MQVVTKQLSTVCTACNYMALALLDSLEKE